ncbi:MAG: ThiF family adenylyltransferase [Bdellovibrionales bacterium]|nr:ThiF family adenylyltransferase [Bdellovibrionales bacterium]
MKPLVEKLFTGGSAEILCEVLGHLTASQDGSRLFSTLKDKGVFIRSSVLADQRANDMPFDRMERFLNTFETEGEGGAQLIAKFQQSTVLLVGLGSYGSVIAEALVRMGLGHLIAYDFDVVETSNLDRQSLYTARQVGLPKSEAARQSLSGIGSPTVLEIHDQEIRSAADLMESAPRADLIINTFGFLSSRYEGSRVPRYIAEAAEKSSKPLLTLGGAQLGPFLKADGCRRYCCFQSYLEMAGESFHPEERSPLVQKRMFYPVTAALAHQAVWEIAAFLTQNGRIRTEDRILHLDWFGDVPVKWLEMPSNWKCERCSCIAE